MSGGHLAERCGLFIIIALGNPFSSPARPLPDGLDLGHGRGIFVAFIGSVAMWWIYFNIGAERASEHIGASGDPGRLARVAYTYTLLLPVAGIIVTAASDELVLAHPLGHTDFKTAATTLVGSALFLTGNLIFKRIFAGSRTLSHMIGLGLLVLLAPAALIVPPLAFAAAASAILVIVAIWETRSLGGHVAAAAHPGKISRRQQGARAKSRKRA